ncbi:MAG: hypothetical protein FJ028_10820, partial [Chloroflexi bacterium]|nr:hypothetical protein [Chloroflexota bacterium]
MGADPVARPGAAPAAEALRIERHKRTRRDRLERAVTLASPILLLVVWEAATVVQFVDVRFFPRPSLV